MIKTCSNHKSELENESSSLKTKEWLNSIEAAAFLSISEASLRNMVTQRKIIPGKLGRRNRYRMEDLRGLISFQRKEIFYGN